jgi:ribosomal protein S18 acetylase RimI-like enzyme
VIGSVSTWHTELDKTFHQATLQSLIQYYGAELVHEVLSRSQLVQEFIPKPSAHQWCIGHLAVAEPNQRQGAATMLLNVMSQEAKRHNKIELSLDVPIDNHSAISFYQHYGFKIQQQSILSQAMLDAGFSCHLHMGKSLV